MGIIVLQGISAIEAWDIGLCGNAPLVEQLDLSQCASNAEEFRAFRDILPELTRPLHVAVSHANNRRPSKIWAPHVLKRDLPKNSYVSLGDGIYVEAPYLCATELVKGLPFPHACMLCMELCGGYSTLHLHQKQNRIDPKKGYLERPALTSVAQLARYAEAAGLGPKAKLRRVCKSIANDAASPRETALHLLVHMDAKSGGYGIGGYELNSNIPLKPELEALVGVPHLKADMYWKDRRFALEYDGRDYHADDAQRAYDNIRRAVLRALGIGIVTVDKHQMKSVGILDGVMQVVSNAVGGPPVRHDPETRLARIDLRKQLLAPGLNLYRC